ncbi:MAG: hypothetical protein ACOCYG_08405 [Spirochaetota bacterium]
MRVRSSPGGSGTESPAESNRQAVPAPPDTRAFPAAHGWLGLERHLPASGEPLFAWDFDLGYHLVLYGGDRVTVSGLGRLLYQNEGVPGRRFGLNPSAIVSDLQLRARFPQLPLNPALWYRHDCKHDIARKRIDLIHDVLGVSLEERFHLWSGAPFDRTDGRAAGAPPERSSRRAAVEIATWVRLTVEYDLPLIFQDYEANANVATAHLAVRPELDLGGTRPVLFAEARGSVLVDDPESDFATAGRVRLDGLARAGVSWPERNRGTTLYGQVERVTNPWRLPPEQSEPVVIYSVGLMLSGPGD